MLGTLQDVRTRYDSQFEKDSDKKKKEISPLTEKVEKDEKRVRNEIRPPVHNFEEEKKDEERLKLEKFQKELEKNMANLITRVEVKKEKYSKMFETLEKNPKADSTIRPEQLQEDEDVLEDFKRGTVNRSTIRKKKPKMVIFEDDQNKSRTEVEKIDSVLKNEKPSSHIAQNYDNSKNNPKDKAQVNPTNTVQYPKQNDIKQVSSMKKPERLSPKLQKDQIDQIIPENRTEAVKPKNVNVSPINITEAVREKPRAQPSEPKNMAPPIDKPETDKERPQPKIDTAEHVEEPTEFKRVTRQRSTIRRKKGPMQYKRSPDTAEVVNEESCNTKL